MKTTFLFILFFVFCKSLSAQISVGLSVGNNFSKIKNNTDYQKYPDLIKPTEEEYFFTNGLFIGIPVEVNLTDKLSLFSTLSYLQKGTRFNSTVSLTDFYTSEGNGTVRYNYLELPLQAKFSFLKKKTKIYFKAGPDIGYLISDRHTYKSTNYNSELDTVTYEDGDFKRKFKDMKDSGLKRIAISLAIGAGCDYEIGGGKIYLDLKYTTGLTNILKNGDGFARGANQHINGFTTTIGYLVPLIN